MATEEPAPKVTFVAKRLWKQRVAEEIDLTTYKVAHESKFLSENVVFYSLERKPKYVFVFHRGQGAVVKALAVLDARTIERRLSNEGGAPADRSYRIVVARPTLPSILFERTASWNGRVP